MPLVVQDFICSIVKPHYYAMHPMQCDYRAPNHLEIDSAAACSRAETVRSPQSCATRIPCDNNARSGPPAVTATEAHTFQRNRESGSDTLVESHIPGSNIRRSAGSKRVGQRESQKPPGQNYHRILTRAKTQSCRLKLQIPAIAVMLVSKGTVERRAPSTVHHGPSALVKRPFAVLRCAVAATCA